MFPEREGGVNRLSGHGAGDEIGGETGLGSEARAVLFQAAFEAAPIAMAVTDVEGRYVMVNQALSGLVGQSEAELIGAHFQARVHPDDLAGEMAQLERLLSLEITCYEAEGRRIHAERGIVWIRERVSLALDREGRAIIADDGQLPRYVIRQLVDISAEREANAAAEEAHREAVAANQQKTEFLSRMSHELRTPLNAIMGFAQILELDRLTPSQHDALKHIIKGGRHLLNLINEVLDIARIESGNLTLSPEPVPMVQAVSEALDLLRPLAVAQAIEFPDGSDQNQCPWAIVADSSRLKQVLLNLLSNAIKYNRPGGSVSVTCEVAREHWGRISVTDKGAGIPAGLLSELFTPFHRLGAEHSGVEGTGVGLALSRRLVEAMGGILSVDTIPGEGSTFSVELPLATGHVTHRQDPPVEPILSTAEGGVDARPRILYIEDNLANLRLMERIFQHTELISAMQGELGLILARQHHPDLVLLDLHLPDLSGEEVLRRLRADPATAQLPVVIVSADATPGQLRRLLACGAQAYLTKPLDVHEVRQVVDDLLHRHVLQ